MGLSDPRWARLPRRSVVPKSTRPDRIAEDIDVFDTELSADDLAAIDELDTGVRGGPEPDAITHIAAGEAARRRGGDVRCTPIEAFGRAIPAD